MRTGACFASAFLAGAALALTALAGPEPMPQSDKQSKEVAPPPSLPSCDWRGVYFGLHAGGQFGHSQTNDLDEYYLFAHHHFGYSESGFAGGGQIGYNFQFGQFVFGPEFDLGYMDLDGHGAEPMHLFQGEASGRTDSDFYITLRGRVGYALDWHGCWLLYATGGAIGVNYKTSYVVDEVGAPGINTSKTEFNWGPTVGGGIERQLGRHWSIKIEYLYFDLDEQSFVGVEQRMLTTHAPNGIIGEPFRFEGETFGHIVRAGLNFRF